MKTLPETEATLISWEKAYSLAGLYSGTTKILAIPDFNYDDFNVALPPKLPHYMPMIRLAQQSELFSRQP